MRIPPKLKHWKAARGTLGFLKVKSSYGVTFQRGSGLELIFYVDAAYAPKDTKRKSVSGAAMMSGDAVIQWVSTTQKCTTLSSSETEYVAMALRRFSYGPCGVFYFLILGIRASRFLRTTRCDPDVG